MSCDIAVLVLWKSCVWCKQRGYAQKSGVFWEKKFFYLKPYKIWGNLPKCYTCSITGFPVVFQRICHRHNQTTIQKNLDDGNVICESAKDAITKATDMGCEECVFTF